MESRVLLVRCIIELILSLLTPFFPGLFFFFFFLVALVRSWARIVVCGTVDGGLQVEKFFGLVVVTAVFFALRD